MTRTVIVVDGYSTARELVKEINLHGGTCVHVRSAETPPARLSAAFDSSPYRQDLGYLGSVAEAAAVIQPLKPVAVVAGSEPGVEYAEAVAHKLGLPSNRADRAKARRNKFEMAKAIEAAGLAGARQEIAENADDAAMWAQAQGSWPVVVKPLESAGSDGVVVCRSVEDVKSAADAALNKSNLLGISNTAVLVQTYIEGVQFFVNTISVAGRHTVTDIWRMTLRPVPGYSNAMEDWFLLDPGTDEARSLIEYTFKAIDALGIVNGPAVSEVRMTKSGPALIETGARLNGPTMEREPYILSGLKGTQATALAQQLVAPQLFEQEWVEQGGYIRQRLLAKSFFIFKGDGVVTETAGLKKLEGLKSFHSHHRPLSIGDHVALTTDTVGRGGVVYWISDNESQLHADICRFREWDDRGELYTVDYRKD